MRKIALGVATLIALVVVLALTGVFALTPGEADAANPDDIEGTWKLVSRDLPDGTTVTPPAVGGLITFRDGYRNFNVWWSDPGGGGLESIASVSTYELTEDAYTENNVYYVMNDRLATGGVMVTYDLTGQSGTAAVTREDGALSFDLPLFGEPHVVFEGDALTATREGEFVDHWERVE